MDGILKQVKTVQGIPLLACTIPDCGTEALRSMGDILKQKLGGIIVLGSVLDGKVSLVAMVDPIWVKKGFSASEILKKIAPMVGGSGGGRPEMAQAGGKDPSKLTQAIGSVEGII